MRNFIKRMAVILTLAGAATAAFAQEAAIEWDALNKNIFEHYRTGDYDRAIVAAKKALEIAEDNVGPDHPKVATSLNNLAFRVRGPGVPCTMRSRSAFSFV